MKGTIPDVSVLCVDDDAELVSLLADGLERESDRLDVTTTTDVDAALETYRATGVDCIVSDYHMPTRTGVELLEVVRADDPKLPFVMYTRTGSEAVASESIRAGVTDYVVRRATDEQYGLLTERILTHVDGRRSERRASRTNRTLRALSAATDEVLFMFSADWSELEFINDAYETVFGGSVDRLRATPKSFLTHVYPEDVDRVTDAMERVSGGRPQQMEYRVDRSADIRIWVESRCKPVRDDSGDVEAVAGFTREVTERKHREQELEDRNETLDRFAATVAHDLRNPLAVADAKLKLARAETDSEHIDDGIEAVDRMSRLIDELLALAKEGIAIDERSRVDLREVVEASIEDVIMTDATCTVEDTARVSCDPSRLREVLTNLFRNAIDHAGGSVDVTVGLLDDGFYLEDDGTGIPADERDQVFDHSYTTAADGTGVGLFIIEQIVDAHDWTIEAVAGADGGARFEVTGVDLAV